MKKIAIATLLTFSVASFAKTNINQDVADAVNKDTEIQAVVKAISSSRDLKCTAPGDEEVSVGKVSHGIRHFTADYGCNQYDNNGEPMANVQSIRVKGYIFQSEQGKIITHLTGLEIIESE